MYLTYRLGRESDVDRCLSVGQHGFAMSPRLRPNISRLWRELLNVGALEVAVIEDLEREEAGRVVGFGARVFISDEFRLELRLGRAPYPGAVALERYMDGHSPMLDMARTRRANEEGGLALLVLQYGWDDRDLTAEETVQLRDKMIEPLTLDHRGYKLNDILVEVYGDEERKRSIAGGMHEVSDYSAYFEAHPKPVSGAWPYLFGLTREAAVGGYDGSRISTAFLYSPPRFYFAAGEQEVLRYALRGETDEEIAKSLDIALVTVKKRWTSIYDRVLDIAPSLLGATAQSTEEPSARGREKRRHILGYVRQHPEEISRILTQSGRGE